MRVRTAAIIALLIAGSITAAIVYLVNASSTPNSTPLAAVSDADQPEAPTFAITALQLTDDNRRIITCQERRCRTLTPPQSVANPPVTDIEAWYHYVDTENNRGQSVRTLVRTTTDAQHSTTIVEETPLVKPRGLIISPDNQKVAYWLDNIDQPHQQLTELWVYDAEQGGTKLVAEKLHQPDILTTPRWNRAATHVWFLANTAADNQPSNIELLLVAIQPPHVSSRFSSTDWSRYQTAAASAPMDINATGDSLAYVTSAHGKQQLIIDNETTSPHTSTIREPIAYVRWLEDDSLLYITQRRGKFTIWRRTATVHQRLADATGQLVSAKLATTGQHLILATRLGQAALATTILDITQGHLIPQGHLPTFGERTYLVHAQAVDQPAPDLAGISTILDDNQIASFVERNRHTITNDQDVQLRRLLVTDTPNTAYLDYHANGINHRLLLTISDLLHHEWSITARYQAQGGEWIKTDGRTRNDPQPTKLYEWEPALTKWILKETY